MTKSEFEKYAHALGFAVGSLNTYPTEAVKPIIENLKELLVFISGLELEDD